MINLTPGEIQIRDRLIDKFREGPLTISEAEALRDILEKEKRQAIELGDIALLFGLVLLLGVVIDYLSNQKKGWRRLFRK
jgi:hypothetical protein